MDFRDKVYIAVAENLSFSKAAEQVFISQPAVTKHIREMENKLGAQLFQRKGNKIHLTQAGQLAYHHLKKIEKQYNEMTFEIGSLTNQFKGSLRIGASSTISQYVLPPVLAAFHQRFPQIELFVLNGNSFEMEQKLEENQVDVALVENYSSRMHFKYIDFLTDEIVAITGYNSNLSKLPALSVADLQMLPLIIREHGSGTLEVIEQAFHANKIDLSSLNITLHLGSTEAIKNFITQYEGIALISKLAITKEMALKHVRQIPIRDFRIQRSFRIVLPDGPELKVPEAFKQFLFHYNF